MENRKLLFIDILKDRDINSYYKCLKNYCDGLGYISYSGDDEYNYKVAISRSKKIIERIEDNINNQDSVMVYYSEFISEHELLIDFLRGYDPLEDDSLGFFYYIQKIKDITNIRYFRTHEKIDYNSFWRLIHPEITKHAKPRFDSTHYADAVESSLKHINEIIKEIVKNKTRNEYDGADLMRHAFSEKTPIIIFESIDTETGRNIQKGYMDIFAGSMTGIRNPKAHENITITPDRALHLITLASLLMYKIDDAFLNNNKSK